MKKSKKPGIIFTIILICIGVLIVLYCQWDEENQKYYV